MDPPHVKSSCRRENQMSNPMGIGLGIEYAHGGISISFHARDRKNLQSSGYKVRNLLCNMEEYP